MLRPDGERRLVSVTNTPIRRGEAIYSTTLSIPPLSDRIDPYNVLGFQKLRWIADFEEIPLTEIVPRGFSESFVATKMMIEQVRTLLTDREALSQVAATL